jgi:hypothetical protein
MQTSVASSGGFHGFAMVALVAVNILRLGQNLSLRSRLERRAGPEFLEAGDVILQRMEPSAGQLAAPAKVRASSTSPLRSQ